MDTLEVLEKAENLGNPERRKAMMETVVMARNLGCDFSVGGGKVGGFNVRYGSLKYAVMDLNCRGEVFLHIKPHPSKGISDEDRDKANDFVQGLEGITIKNAPINHYGQIEEPIEEVPLESLEKFLHYIVGYIRTCYYQPHQDEALG